MTVPCAGVPKDKVREVRFGLSFCDTVDRDGYGLVDCQMLPNSVGFGDMICETQCLGS